MEQNRPGRLPVGQQHLATPDFQTLAAKSKYANFLLFRRNQSTKDALDALALFKEAKEGYERLLGDGHPFTLSALNEEALCLREMAKEAQCHPEDRQAKLAEALELFDKVGNKSLSPALCLRCSPLSPTSPHLVDQVIDGRTRFLSASHHETLSSMGNKATVLWEQGSAGSRKEALDLLRRVSHGQALALGEDHKTTLKTKKRLLEWETIALAL